MGKIKKILEKELGSTQSVEVYPVTSIEAVYGENNERLDNIINRKNNETQKELKAEVARATNAESNLRETINNITEINENATSANIVTIDNIPNTSASNVQQALNELFKNATFAGIATPATNPGTPDSPVFYIATTAGTYTNFSGIKITEGEAVILEWRGSWVKKTTGFATQGKLTEIENNVGLYNVDKNIPLGSGHYTPTTARAAIPTAVRKLGLIITYKTDSTTSVTEQFTGSSISSWTTDTNWTNVGSDGGNKILEWNTDFATTRKQVPLKERKAGMQISYLHPDFGWVNEQYIGTLFTDTEWVKNENWSKIASQNEIIELESKLTVILHYVSYSNGFIKSDGTISTQYGGNHYKYDVSDKNTVLISGIIGVEPNSIWAVYQLRKSGEVIKTQLSTQREYSGYKIDVSDADEIWVNSASGGSEMDISSPDNVINDFGKRIKKLEYTSLTVQTDNTSNILSFTDKDGNILAYFDKNGNLIAKGINSGGGTSENHWRGKKWYAYGTSITSIQQGQYVQQLSKLSGMVAVNKGIPGGGITNLGGYAKGQVKAAIMTLDDGKAKADLITLEVGPNEGGEIGTKFDTGDETFCGCLNQCIRYLQENTSAQIVVMTSVSTTTEPAEEYYNRLAIIKEVCEINRVYHLDGNCGLGWARIKSSDKKYIVDNIHQTELGGLILAKYMWSIIKNIPAWDLSI